ncbi:MAG: hypothetical protein ABIP53_09735 [Candidatus Limnocylindrales bacterium]
MAFRMYLVDDEDRAIHRGALLRQDLQCRMQQAQGGDVGREHQRHPISVLDDRQGAHVERAADIDNKRSVHSAQLICQPDQLSRGDVHCVVRPIWPAENGQPAGVLAT